MNAVEIEKAVSLLAGAPFDADTFPFNFLKAFGNKSLTIESSEATGAPVKPEERFCASLSILMSDREH